MRVSSAVLSGSFRRRPLVVLGSLVFFVAAAYEAAGYVIAGDMVGLAFIAMAFVGCAFVIAILNNWQRGLYFFLAWLLFEDFARKYLGNNMAIYFAKDSLLLVIYISFIAAYRRKEVTGFRPPFLTPLLLFIWFGVIQIFTPCSTHIRLCLFGFK